MIFAAEQRSTTPAAHAPVAAVGLPLHAAELVDPQRQRARGRQGSERLRVRMAKTVADPARDDRYARLHPGDEGRRAGAAAAVVPHLEEIGSEIGRTSLEQARLCPALCVAHEERRLRSDADAHDQRVVVGALLGSRARTGPEHVDRVAARLEWTLAQLGGAAQNDALEIASDVVGNNATITHLHTPPLLIADVQ